MIQNITSKSTEALTYRDDVKVCPTQYKSYKDILYRKVYTIHGSS